MKFLAYAKVVGTKWLGEIEADTEADALKQAQEKSLDTHISLCHQCSDQVEEPQIDEVFVEPA